MSSQPECELPEERNRPLPFPELLASGLLNLKKPRHSLRRWFSADSDSAVLGQSLRLCICNKLPGDSHPVAHTLRSKDLKGGLINPC